MITKRVRITDLGTVITGGTPPTKKREFYGDKVPLIKPTDMNLGQRYIGNTEESLSEIGINKFKKKLVPENTPCVVTIGTIGKSCLTKEVSLVNQAVNCIVVDSDKYDYMYVYYLMQLTIPKVKALNSGTASGRENVSKSAFESIEVDVLPLSQQVRVGRTLSAYDSLIENNRRRIAILEETAQSLYREWFVKFRFPGHEQCQMVNSSFGLVPDGWVIRKLEDVADVNPESVKPKSAPEQIHYIDIKSVSTGNIDEVRTLSFSEAPSRARRIVRDQDIIWATVRPNRKQFSYICKPIENTIASTGFAVLRAKNIPASYLYFFTTTDSFTSYLVNHASGAAYPAVNTSDFNNADILLPSSDILAQFDNAVKDTLVLSENLKRKNQNLKKQRDLLLPKLISGQIEL